MTEGRSPSVIPALFSESVAKLADYGIIPCRWQVQQIVERSRSLA